MSEAPLPVRPEIRPERPPGSDRAFVTLVTNADFAVGAAALLRSLVRTGTEADRVVLHTEGVGEAALAPLRALGARLVATDLLPTSSTFDEAHAKGALHARAPFTRGEKPPFHTPLDNFAKLRLWQLPYERAVFLDADTLALRPLDRLFDYPELCAAPNVYEGLDGFRRMNSGVFTARPAPATFEAMMEALDTPGAFWPRTDQSFLQAFFPDWHGLPVTCNMLQHAWINLPAMWDWERIRVLHYQYEKPWAEPHPRPQALAPLVALWRAHAADGPVPDPATLPPPPGA